MKILSLFAATILTFTGCARFGTVQQDISYDPKTGNPIRKITTKVASSTFYDSKSALANSKVSQTDKSQSANLGSLSQDSTNNTATTIKALADFLNAAKP